MRIALITTDITNSGGTERVVCMVANYLVRRGFGIQVHSLTTESGAPFYNLDDQVEIFHHSQADYSTESSAISKSLKKVRNTLYIKTVIRSINADLLIGTGKHINIYLALFANRSKCKIVGCEHFAYNAPMSGVTRMLRRYFYPKLNSLVVLTSKDKEFYDRFVPNVECIPNAVSIKLEHRISAEDQVILAIGRHTEQKGFDLLISIWSKLSIEFPSWKMIIVGDGPLLEIHKQQALSLGVQRLEFKQPTKNIEGYYKISGIYAMTSRYEAFPMVLLEAMSCGIPCVAYNCDTGPEEIIRNGEDGFIVDYLDDTEFLRKMKLLMTNQELRMHMGASAAENIRRYNMSEIGNRWLSLLNKI